MRAGGGIGTDNRMRDSFNFNMSAGKQRTMSFTTCDDEGQQTKEGRELGRLGTQYRRLHQHVVVGDEFSEMRISCQDL